MPFQNLDDIKSNASAQSELEEKEREGFKTAKLFKTLLDHKGFANLYEAVEIASLSDPAGTSSLHITKEGIVLKSVSQGSVDEDILDSSSEDDSELLSLLDELNINYLDVVALQAQLDKLI